MFNKEIEQSLPSVRQTSPGGCLTGNFTVHLRLILKNRNLQETFTSLFHPNKNLILTVSLKAPSSSYLVHRELISLMFISVARE